MKLPEFYVHVDDSYTTVPTALDTFDIMSCGGFREGSVVEIYGPNASGKSAFAYATAAKFLKKYPDDAEVWVFDTEDSFDKERIENVFGIDSFRLRKFDIESMGLKKDGLCLEDMYETVIKAVEYTKEDNDINRILFIVDTIATLPPRADVKELKKSGKIEMYGGGMGLTSRVNSYALAQTFNSMIGAKVTLLILNQIRAKIGTYRPEVTSSGGHAKEHYDHYKFFFKKISEVPDEHDNITHVVSSCDIQKSKFTPRIKRLKMTIDVTLGGKVVPNDELFHSCSNFDIIISNGPKWKLADNEYAKANNVPSFYRRHLQDPNHEHFNLVRPHLLELLARYFRERYITIDAAYRRAGLELGKPVNPKKDNSIQPLEINYKHTAKKAQTKKKKEK